MLYLNICYFMFCLLAAVAVFSWWRNPCIATTYLRNPYNCAASNLFVYIYIYIYVFVIVRERERESSSLYYYHYYHYHYSLKFIHTSSHASNRVRACVTHARKW